MSLYQRLPDSQKLIWLLLSIAPGIVAGYLASSWKVGAATLIAGFILAAIVRGPILGNIFRTLYTKDGVVDVEAAERSWFVPYLVTGPLANCFCGYLLLKYGLPL